MDILIDGIGKFAANLAHRLDELRPPPVALDWSLPYSIDFRQMGM